MTLRKARTVWLPLIPQNQDVNGLEQEKLQTA